MDAQRGMRELAKPLVRGEKIEVIIQRCVRFTGFSYSRCYEIYYGRARRIEHSEFARISEALKQKQAMDARNELAELRLRLERLESLLVLSDQEFHRETIDQTRAQLRGCR